MNRTQVKIWRLIIGFAVAGVVVYLPTAGSVVSAQEVIWRGPVSAYYFGKTTRSSKSSNSGYGRNYDNGNGERYYSGYGPAYNDGTYGPATNGGFGQNSIQGYGNVYGGPNAPHSNAPAGPAYSTVRGDLGYSKYFPRNVNRFDPSPDQGYGGYGYGAPGVLPR